jgi:arylsulfatase A
MCRSTLRWSLTILFVLFLAAPLALTSAGAAAAAAAAPTKPVSRPNIVLFLCDDLGIGNVSYAGADAPFRTPQIDALAAQSLRFDRAFSAPICGPTRAQIMTGQYSHRHGVVDNAHGKALNPADRLVLPQVMRRAGYKTAAAGKWPQLEYLDTREDGTRWGFDEFMTWHGFGTPDRYWSPRFNHNGSVRTWDDNTYGPDVLQQFVVDFIARHKGEPFFVYYSHPIPHAPRSRTPDSAETQPDKWEMYADQVAYLDKQVGLFVKELDRLGVRENTLILFAGDNGAVAGGGTIRGRKLDGGKGSAGEGACRVPMFASWPAVISSGRACNDLIDVSDLLPTFADLAGAALPTDYAMDGRSFAPQLRGEKGNPRQWVYAALNRPEDPIRWVRDDHYRLRGNGELTSVKDAPFADAPVDASDPAAQAARARLQQVLDR